MTQNLSPGTSSHRLRKGSLFSKPAATGIIAHFLSPTASCWLCPSCRAALSLCGFQRPLSPQSGYFSKSDRCAVESRRKDFLGKWPARSTQCCLPFLRLNTHTQGMPRWQDNRYCPKLAGVFFLLLLNNLEMILKMQCKETAFFLPSSNENTHCFLEPD